MAYKSILTFATQEETSAATLDFATRLATTQDGHLEVMCVGIDRAQVSYYAAGANALIQQETFVRAQKDAVECEAWARAELKNNPGPWAVDHALASAPNLGRLVSVRSHFADVVVLPKPYGENRHLHDETLLEAALFEGHAPIIVVPDTADISSAPKRIVVAWNDSPEALHAIRAALPLLIAAESVSITVVDPPAHGENRSDPGGPLSQMLARHGVNAEISVLAKSLPRVADVLIRHVTDTDADMLVMGAYGHSRFREAILGGATRHMLERAEIPVFMAH